MGRLWQVWLGWERWCSAIVSFSWSGWPPWWKAPVGLSCEDVWRAPWGRKYLWTLSWLPFHLLDFIDLWCEFHMVVWSHRRVVAQLGVIRVDVSHAIGGHCRRVTFMIGVKFGFCTKNFCWMCADLTWFYASDGRWCSSFGGSVIGGRLN